MLGICFQIYFNTGGVKGWYMKLIMLLNRRDTGIAHKYPYCILKRDVTVIKNLELINNEDFLKSEEGNYKFYIEKWEKYDSKRTHIVCGKHGAILRPVHVVSNTNDRKALFQTEHNMVLRINFEKNYIQIYENKISGNSIIGSLRKSISYDDFVSGKEQVEHFGTIIKEVIQKINEENFKYIKPLYALPIDNKGEKI